MVDYYLSKNGPIPEFLLKYLNVPSLVRLKSISYFCGMDYASKDIYDFKEKITRYDHSLSVALLTWRLTNSKEATLAGLFHDIGTPCFSHVIDYMNKDYETQESTEKYTELIIRSDKLLLTYLNNDGINVDDIINFKNYSIVDNNRPKLCADRLDGIIMTGIGWTKSITKNDIDFIIDDICVYKNEIQEDEIGFKNKKSAVRALEISDEINKYCHSYEDNYMMELLANITKYAIDSYIISYDMLYRLTEDQIWYLIEQHEDDYLKSLISTFRNIKLRDIPITELGNVKDRNLNPLVLSLRLKDNL